MIPQYIIPYSPNQEQLLQEAKERNDLVVDCFNLLDEESINTIKSKIKFEQSKIDTKSSFLKHYKKISDALDFISNYSLLEGDLKNILWNASYYLQDLNLVQQLVKKNERLTNQDVATIEAVCEPYQKAIHCLITLYDFCYKPKADNFYNDIPIAVEQKTDSSF